MHPLNVESVAWISERKNVLSTFFWLLTLLAYARYVEKSRVQDPRSKISYGLTLLIFALGLMSKPMLVTLPFTLLLLDYWPLGRWQMSSIQDRRGRMSRLLLEKIPFFLLSALACVLTLLVQRKGEAVQPAGLFALTGRVENMPVSYCRYLAKTFWPEHLAVFYPHPGHWPLMLVISAGLSLIVASWAGWHFGRRFPFLITGWFWFLGTLFPVIGLVQVGRQSMADRYAYVPLIGIFIVVSWGAAELLSYWRSPKVIAAILAGLVLTASGIQMRQQLGCWQNDGTLFRQALAVTANNFVAQYNLGNLSGQTRTGEAKRLTVTAWRFGLIPAGWNRTRTWALFWNISVRSVKPQSNTVKRCGLSLAARRPTSTWVVHSPTWGNAMKPLNNSDKPCACNPGLRVAELRLQELGASPSRQPNR